MADQSAGARLAVDIGGTFTDVVLEHDGRQTTAKVLTTAAAPEEGVLAGVDRALEEAGVAPTNVTLLIHGTTLATNAIIERKGARIALITTEGHRDSVEMALENRFEQYDIMIDRPPPLAARRMRWPVRERMNVAGDPLIPLVDASVEAILPEIERRGVEALAVGLLHAYANPAHEERVREIVRAAYPDLPISISSEVCPEIREYERQSTTCANAYVQPKMAGYLTELDERLKAKGFACPFLLMTSGGGLTTLENAVRFPIRLVESGPAGGAILAAEIAAETGLDRVVSYDMGGTTAKICLIDDGQPLSTRTFEVARAYRNLKGSGLPVRIPAIEMVEIGAGGGSIAHVDAGGAFRVGPRSAGAVPGPAAYGRGGTRPTVTDANVALGRLDPENFLGGAMSLDIAAARDVVSGLAGDLGLGLEDTADGILRVVNANMANLVRSRTVQKGLDPRSFSLVAFGGGGPLQAVDVAAMLGIPEVIVPPAPGITSAMGLAATDMKYDLVRSVFATSAEPDPARLEGLLSEMQGELADRLEADGFDEDVMTFERAGDLRYVGQGYELRCAFPASLDADGLAAVFDDFTEQHRREYGRINPGAAIEIVNVRVRGVGAMPVLERPAPPPGGSLAEALVRTAHVAFRVAGAMTRLPTPVYRREALPLDTEIPGPALIVQKDTTSMLRPGDSLVADQGGNLLIRVAQEG